jgi:hypothetical protein
MYWFWLSLFVVVSCFYVFNYISLYLFTCVACIRCCDFADA